VPSATSGSQRDAALSRTLSPVRDGDHLPNLAEFATAAEQAASARAASIVSVHTASPDREHRHALAADEPEAMAVALASFPLR